MALLESFESEFGTIRVTEDRDGTRAYVQNGCFHSQADKNGTSICVYIHMMVELIRGAGSDEILIVGGAGGTLATMLWRLNKRVTIVDIDPLAFKIARRYFALPSGIRCVTRDGIRFLRSTKKTYEAVVIDVFGSKNAVPAQFTAPAFFRSVRRVCAPGGLLLMNVITASNRDTSADRYAHRAMAAGFDIAVFDWPDVRDRNTLLAGGLARGRQFPSGREPKEIRSDLAGLIRRAPRRRLFDRSGARAATSEQGT